MNFVPKGLPLPFELGLFGRSVCGLSGSKIPIVRVITVIRLLAIAAGGTYQVTPAVVNKTSDVSEFPVPEARRCSTYRRVLPRRPLILPKRPLILLVEVPGKALSLKLEPLAFVLQQELNLGHPTWLR